jgi:DNA-binding NtrC family response regulator
MEQLSPFHVLVVEDDPDTRANLRDILELDDYQVEAAGSIAEALGRDDWSAFTAIILDRRLPDGTAEEILPRLKQLAPRAAIIIVTGYADLQGSIAALRLGAADYLLKPLNLEELRTRLGHIAERVRAEEQIRTLSTILAESPSPVLRVGRDGILRSANTASAPLLALWG